MSRQINVIIPAPDENMRTLYSEHFTYEGYPCPYCKGNGWFWGLNQTGEYVKDNCPLCKGKKELEACITIEWKINENK